MKKKFKIKVGDLLIRQEDVLLVTGFCEANYKGTECWGDIITFTRVSSKRTNFSKYHSMFTSSVEAELNWGSHHISL